MHLKGTFCWERLPQRRNITQSLSGISTSYQVLENTFQARDQNQLLFHLCHRPGHFSWDCTIKHMTEDTGIGGGPIGVAMWDIWEELYCDRGSWRASILLGAAKFGMLGDLFSLREVRWMYLVELRVTVHSNNFCLGTPIETLLNSGSSAMIMSFEMFRKVGQAAGILQDALQLPDITLKDYSRKPILIFEVVVLEFEWQGN